MLGKGIRQGTFGKKGMQYFLLEFYGALVVTTERIAVVRVAETFRPGEGATCARTDGRNF